MTAKTIDVAPRRPAHEITACCRHFALNGVIINAVTAGRATNVKNSAISTEGSRIPGICEGNASNPKRKNTSICISPVMPSKQCTKAFLDVYKRPVLDATLRDGGLCNDFDFSDAVGKALYQTNVKAGVDYMEFGYKADPDLFHEDEFGKWKFCRDDDIRTVVGDNNTGMKISVMAAVGRCNYERDIIPKSESPIDMVRIATYLHTIPKAMEMIDYCHKQGLSLIHI